MSAVSDAAKASIREAYANLMESRSLVPRWGQRQMIAEVANTLARMADGATPEEPPIAVIEAGTGTGKTIAYLIPGIILARELGKRLVVATATVALQEQLVGRDLPDLQAGSGLEFDYALAKGRRRYLCLSQLDRILAREGGGATLALYPDEVDDLPEASALETYSAMLDALGRGTWNGDRDSWPARVEDTHWFPVTADQGQCTGRKCPNIRQCSFFRAREQLQNADLIVTNHDLVLSDLALGGGAILPAPEDSIYVFDEGHHLPDKALGHFSSFCRLSATQRWLRDTRRALSRGAPLLGSLATGPDALQTLEGLAEDIAAAMEVVAHEGNALLDAQAEGERLRFSGGRVPESLVQLSQTLAALWARFSARLAALERALEDATEDSGADEHGDEFEAWQMALGGMVQRAESVLSLWADYNREDEPGKPPKARWIIRRDDGDESALDFHCSSILAADILDEQLWSRAAGVVLTSATMTALNSFDRFRLRSGVPEGARCAVVASPFDYQRATLQLPPMTSDGGDPPAHTEELVALLPEILDLSEGSLVLFSSRRQMLDVRDGLPPEWSRQLLTQDDYGKQELLARHRDAIDGGKGSVIFGLASFAEGVDLPGDYCRHVVIAKLPFSVPDDPVDAALAEWIEAQGRNPFMEISVPDAALRLVQASGRLLRTETDTGRVTILDRRLLTRRYGKAILDSLPPFNRVLG